MHSKMLIWRTVVLFDRVGRFRLLSDSMNGLLGGSVSPGYSSRIRRITVGRDSVRRRDFNGSISPNIQKRGP